MKILHVMPSLARSYGGPTQSWIGYASAAETQGVEVTVAAPRVNSVDQQWLVSKTSEVNYAFFLSAGKGALVFSPSLQAWLAENGSKYDALHVHGLFNPVSSFALRLCIKQDWPVVLRPFGTLSKYTFHHRRTWMKRKYFQYLDGPSLKKARGLHFTTSAEQEEAGWHGIDFSQCSHVVPPPLHTPLVSEPQKIAEGDSDPIVLLLSRLHPVKNIECLLKAWPLVQRGMPSARLVIAGNGDVNYTETLKGKARSLGPECQIDFPGFVQGEQKKELLARASVFVLPSFQENFGVAVMEAISAGLPVVISKHVQLANYVAQHNLGHVVSPEPEVLAFSILEILRSQSFRHHCRQNGPAAIRRDFSLDSVGRQLVAMYETVIDHHRN